MSEVEKQGQENGMTNGNRPFFREIYFIGLAATIIGIAVIIFLNLATPLEYMRGHLTAPDQIKSINLAQQLAHIFNLAFLLLLIFRLTKR